MFFGKKVTGPAEWLLVCLGNYGKQYENTRHNIGFMAAERLIDKRDLRCNRLRFRALTGQTSVGGEGVLRCRLLDMGLTPRTLVTLRKVAPMGDPIEIHIRGYELTLRVDDARQITVEKRETA